MTQKIKAFCLLMVLGLSLIFVCYCIYTNINSVVDLEQKTESLELEVDMLRSCVRWELILVDTLSVQEKVELDAIEKSLRQKIHSAFRSKGCTALILKKNEKN